MIFSRKLRSRSRVRPQKLVVGEGQLAISKSGGGVELADQRVPGRQGVAQPGPETLGAAALERRQRHALLLDPGIIAEIEDAGTLVMGQFEHIVVGDAGEVLAEHLAGIDRVEAVGIVRGAEFAALADVERGGVGGDGDEEVVVCPDRAALRS